VATQFHLTNISNKKYAAMLSGRNLLKLFMKLLFPSSVYKMEAARFTEYRYISTKLRGDTAQKPAGDVIDALGT
jgi:hypothetical protein